jgi:hypothetical protein
MKQLTKLIARLCKRAHLWLDGIDGKQTEKAEKALEDYKKLSELKIKGLQIKCKTLTTLRLKDKQKISELKKEVKRLKKNAKPKTAT